MALEVEGGKSTLAINFMLMLFTSNLNGVRSGKWKVKDLD